MKKSIKFFVLAAAVLFVTASCSKTEEGGIREEGAAQLTINYGFKDAQTTKAANSTAKPETNWNTNIKSMAVILTNSAGTITNVLTPTPPGIAGMSLQTVATIPNLVQGTYDVYLIANAASAVNTSPYGSVATNPSLELTTAALVGQNISALSFNMVSATGLPTGIASANQEPTEMFWAKGNITVASGNNEVTLSLERVVSLLRIRINKDYVENGVAYNEDVEFDNATASLVLRRTAGTSITAAAGAVAGTANAIMFSKKAFKTANPSTGYSPADMGLGGPEMYTYWNDYLILPGGTANVNTGFDIVITGLAPVGYIARDNAGVALPAFTAASPVFWTAGVDGIAVKNGILELNVTLKSKGVSDIVPPPATYGNLDIKATLTPWGNITSVDINI